MKTSCLYKTGGFHMVGYAGLIMWIRQGETRKTSENK